jgi:hypothetical protein
MAALRSALVKPFAAFAGIGVMPTELEKYLKHPLAQCNPSEMQELRTIFAAIRDGEAKWSDYATPDVAAEEDKAEAGNALKKKLLGSGDKKEPEAQIDGTPAEAPQAAPIQSAREADPQIDFAAEKGIGPDPTQSQEQKIKTPPDPETEKLRTELKGLLAINLNDAEAEEWIRQNFGAAKAAKGLTKADLKAAIVQINAELDARETEI